MTPHTDHPSKGSPDWLVARLDEYMRRVLIAWSSPLSRLRYGSHLFLLIAFVVGTSLLFYYQPIIDFVRQGGGFSFHFLLTRLPLFGAMLITAPLLVYLKPDRYWLILLIFILSYVCGAWALGAFSSAWPIFSSFILTIIIPGAFFVFVLQSRLNVLPFIILCAVTLGCTFIALAATPYLEMSDTRVLPIMKIAHYERVLMIFGVLLAEMQIGLFRGGRAEIKSVISYLLAPSTLTYPLPTYGRYLNRIHGSIPLMSRGLSDFVIGTLAIAVGVFIGRYVFTLASHPWMHDYTTLKSLVVGWLIYLFFFVNSFAIVRCATAVLRWIGYDVPDGYHFPLLATSPQDRWRRWNTYFYMFFRSFVFLPIMRWTSSPFLASLVTFFVTFLFHEASSIIGFFAFDFDNTPLFWSIRQSLAFFCLHGLAVWVGIRLDKFWPSGESLWGWIGVAGTHTIMAAIHSIFI